MVRLGEPVISSSPIPPPRVNESKILALAESSVLVATLMLWPLVSVAAKPGAVTALARDAPCGSAQARRTRCRLSVSILRLMSSACRLCSSVQRPYFAMNPSDFVTCTVPCAIAAGNVEEGAETIHIAELAFRTPRFRGAAGHARGARRGRMPSCQEPAARMV